MKLTYLITCVTMLGSLSFTHAQEVRVEKDIEYAKLVTNDVEATLKRHYALRPAVFERRMHTPGIDHPHHFDNVMRAIRARRAINWNAFDRDHPDAVLTSLSAATARSRRVRAA